ncbi:MAG: hypothetical protein AAFX08_01705 [Pseudomonadota bacterium]
MNRIFLLIAAIGLFSCRVSAQEAEAVARRFVVLNLAGDKFAEISGRPDLVEAHRAVYEAFDAECMVVLGGALRGDTPLGMTIFAVGVDEAAVRARVEADPAVSQGYIAVEFRELSIQRGAVAESPPGCSVNDEN